eukprot:jgi/Pico_ML_1/56029/g1627.t1
MASQTAASTWRGRCAVVTDMTNGNGLIDTETSAAGLLQILAKDPEEINGRFFDYKQEEIPW